MDGLAPRTQDELAELFDASLSRVVGTTRNFGRQAWVRMMSRKLADHYELSGWPDSTGEVQDRVNEAIEKYC